MDLAGASGSYACRREESLSEILASKGPFVKDEGRNEGRTVKVEAVARVLVQPARSTDTVDCTKDVTVLRSYRLAIACLCYEARIQVPYLPRCRAMRLVLWVRYARTRIVYVVLYIMLWRL